MSFQDVGDHSPSDSLHHNELPCFLLENSVFLGNIAEWFAPLPFRLFRILFLLEWLTPKSRDYPTIDPFRAEVIMISQRFIFICELPYIFGNDRNSFFYRYLLNGLEFFLVLIPENYFPFKTFLKPANEKIAFIAAIVFAALFIHFTIAISSFFFLVTLALETNKKNNPELLRKTPRLNPGQKVGGWSQFFFFFKPKNILKFIAYKIQLWHKAEKGGGAEAGHHYLIPS